MEMDVKKLSTLADSEVKAFFSSIETVIFDVDGALIRIEDPIAGTERAIQTLRNLNKNIKFVTNNTTRVLRDLLKLLQIFGARESDIANITTATIDFLAKKGFDKKIYVLGNPALREDLSRAGFKLADEGPMKIEALVSGIDDVLTDDEEVGAVVFDLDLNLTYAKLLKAMVYLSRPEVIYITGISDKKLPYSKKYHLLGFASMQNDLKDISGNVPTCLGKPSLDLGKFMMEKFAITDPSKVLLIGDALEQDIKFASYLGFKKLLVLSGVTTMDDLKRWVDGKNVPPDYYLDSVGDLCALLN